MGAETSLYRRHRPRTFDEVVGQGHVVRTLRNAVERDRVHHAYLFVGSRGTGKTSLAKILAAALNCADGPTVTPCGKCESCRAIQGGTSLDVIEMDAASNRSVDDIRELRERVGYAPAAGGWKVYILDEAHMLTREAWNAFLKTLEEPPPNTVFVLATTEPHKVMATIVDRCQRFDFQRPSLDQIAEVLRRVAAVEGIEIADGAVAAISRSASGSFRDALGTLDQLVAYGGRSVETDDVLAVLGVAEADLILAAADAIAAGDGRAALEASERLARSGRDVVQFGRDLLAHLRQLLVIRTVGEAPDTFSVTAAEPERLHAQAQSFADLALVRAIDAIAAALAAIREGDEARMTVELALLRAARPQLDPSREALLQRLEALEARMGGGAAPRPAPAERERGPASSRGQAASTAQAGEPAPASAPKAKAETGVGERNAGEAPSGVEPNAGEPSAVSPAAPAAQASQAAPAAESPAPPAAQQDDAEAVATLPAVDLERAVDLWPAVVDQVRRAGADFLSHALEAAHPVGVDPERGVLEVGFAPEEGFNKRKAEAGESRERVAEAVRSVLGQPLRPVYVLLEPGGGRVEQPLSEDELVERFKTEFDAEEYDDEAEPDADQASRVQAKEA